MSGALRRDVLQQFKRLHRISQKIFENDEHMLTNARKKINEEFHKSKHVKEDKQIKELLLFATQVETELKNVVQTEEVGPGKYRLKVTEHTPMLDNVPFNENAVIEKPRGRSKCSENKQQ